MQQKNHHHAADAEVVAPEPQRQLEHSTSEPPGTRFPGTAHSAIHKANGREGSRNRAASAKTAMVGSGLGSGPLPLMSER